MIRYEYKKIYGKSLLSGNMNKIRIIFFLLLFTKISFAQFLTKIPFDHYNISSGLSSNNITTIIQDGSGLLYIGTDKGLETYDGYKFERIDISQNENLYITSLLITQTPRKSLWIGTLDSGLIKRDLINNENYFFLFRLFKELRSDRINDLALVDNEIFIGTDSGLTRLNPISGVLHYIPINQNNINITSLKTLGNTLIIGTDQGLFFLNVKSLSTERLTPPELKGMYITSLEIDKNHNIWIGTSSGVFIYNIPEKTLKHINYPVSLSNSYITTIKYTSYNEVWIGTRNNGLFIINQKKHNIEHIVSNPFLFHSIKSNNITTIFEAQNKDIWIGTYGGGLYRYAPSHRHLQYISFYLQPREGKNIQTIARDKKGNIWIATRNAGIKKWNPHTNTTTTFSHNPKSKKSIAQNNITAIYADSKGRIWLGTESKGVDMLDPVKGKVIKHFSQLKDVYISDITEDKDGNIWIATFGKGLIKLHNNKIKTYTKSNSHLPSNFVTRVFCDRKNRIWIGTIKGLAILMPASNKITPILTSDKNLNLLWIYAIYQSDDGNIWLSTKSGKLYKIDKNLQYKEINDTTLTQNNVIYDINGYDGIIWLASKKGLIKYNPHTGKKYILYNGIINCHGGYNRLVKSEKGFYAISDNGLVKIDTNISNLTQYTPRIDIASLEINNKKQVISSRKKIEIKGLKNSLKLILHPIDFHNRFHLFKYKLLGLDTTFHINDKPIIAYKNIPPGKYRLVVKPISATGDADSVIIPLDIVVKRQFTDTRAFALLRSSLYIILFLSVIILMLGYFIRRQRKLLNIITAQNNELKKKNKELEEKIRTIKEQSDYIIKLNEKLSISNEELKTTNQILKEQEELLSAQTQEIESSLQYAQHIQRLLMQSHEDLRQIFSQHFLIYIPQGYVSGDFYWAAQIDNNKIAIVGDATGHGVPGALMAILGLSIIKKVVNEYKITDPQDILNKVKVDLKSFQNKYNYDSEGFKLDREGFALAIAKIDQQNNLIKYATAGGIIYFIDVKNNQLHEFKTARRDITFGFSAPEYTQAIYKYNNGDMLYLFTDGYADQIGGPDGKKFKYRKLKELLKKICVLPVDEQKRILEQNFYQWMHHPSKDGLLPHYFQIDDVTFMGIKLEAD